MPSLDAAHGAQPIDRLKGEIRMLSRDERGAPAVDFAHSGTGTAIPFLHPEIMHLHGFQHRPEQGALLGMAIFTREDIAAFLLHKTRIFLLHNQRTACLTARNSRYRITTHLPKKTSIEESMLQYARRKKSQRAHQSIESSTFYGFLCLFS